jgi:hypothetical protein
MTCRHCAETVMEAHCENRQCNWLLCLNCRKLSVIKKEGV